MLTSVEISVTVAPALRLVVECIVRVVVVGTSSVNVAVVTEVETLFTSKHSVKSSNYIFMTLLLSRCKNDHEIIRGGYSIVRLEQ